MNKWVFEDTPGRFDIDLSHSYVQGRRLRELTVPHDLELGYGADRGTEQTSWGDRTAVQGLGRLGAGHPRRPGGAVAAVRPPAGAGRPGDHLPARLAAVLEAPALMGCQVDAVPLTGDFEIDVDAVAEVATSRLRIIVVSRRPTRPGGGPAGRSGGLVEILERHDGYLVLDQNYESDLTPPLDEGADRTFSVSGLSKVYGFPGLRIGWMYGPAGIVRDCADRKHLSSISNSVLCEMLACDVLDRGEHYLSDFYAHVSAGLRVLPEWVPGTPACCGCCRPSARRSAGSGCPTTRIR